MTMRGLLVALQFLTRLPVPPVADPSPADLGRAAPWFPAAGLVVGVAVALAAAVGDLAGPWIAALLALVVWIAITGALHLDGLGDVADALGAAHGSPERFRAVLADPHIGTFGVVAIVLQLTAKLVLMAHVPTVLLVSALVLVPAWARWGALAWRSTVPPLGEGLGRSFQAGDRNWRAPVIWAVWLALASSFIAPVLLIAIAVVPAMGLYWRWRLGGMSGDCHGAGIEVTETALLAALVLSAA